jgi:general secretion pathway protein G
MHKQVGRDRKAFTLVELVVVVLIIGIIAAVAAPRMFDTAKDARESSTRQSLIVLRDAIELYNSRNSAYPTVAALKTALATYLNGPFPAVQIGNNRNADVVASTQDPIATPEAGTAGWVYNPTTGSISVNEGTYIDW